jgi:hypothetical protein
MPFALDEQQAREIADWQIVEQRETEWVLMRDIERWSAESGVSQRPEQPRQLLTGTAIITWSVALGRPLGIEFTGEFISRDRGLTQPIPVTVQVVASE